ncbi:MAG: Hsp20/alpha crystallin family protein [Thermovirgaceae bacterium]
MNGRTLIPFGNMPRTIFDDMDEMFRGFTDALRPMARRFAPVEMYEEKDEIVVEVDVPGIEPSKLEIKTFPDRVTFQCKEEEKDEKQEEGKTYYLRRQSRSINYSVNLPVEVDPNKAKASFKNGVVTVRLPKSETVQGRVLSIEQE